jgi:hypothetical protein
MRDWHRVRRSPVRRDTTTDVRNCGTGQLRSLLALAIDRPGEYGSLLARARDVEQVERLLAGVLRTPDRESRVFEPLIEPHTSLSDLRTIRDSAKEFIERVKSEPEREAAALVYHAATAAALGRHGINLSSVPPESRVPLYEDLATALAGHPLAGVFRDAVDYVSSEASS